MVNETTKQLGEEGGGAFGTSHSKHRWTWYESYNTMRASVDSSDGEITRGTPFKIVIDLGKAQGSGEQQGAMLGRAGRPELSAGHPY